MREWTRKNPEAIRAIRRRYKASAKGKETNSRAAKAYRRRQKEKVVEHYSKGTNQCACCAEKMFEFLTVDHIGGGGTKHRKEIGTRDIIPWLVVQNFPPGFQILCFNCNCAKGAYGKCPHEQTS